MKPAQLVVRPTVRLLAALLCGALALSILITTARAQGPDAPATHWVTRQVQAPRVSFHTFDSAAAKAKVSYHLYTPAAYEREPEQRLPVVYWLHGSGGGLAGIPQVARHFDEAIEAGKMPPCLVVFVNGMVGGFEGMYVDWKDGTAPLETVIVKDLVPHIDGAYRTIATRQGRMLDGFSMGGYGAARLGFKFPEVFRAVSIVGAGPMQEELVQTPRAGRRRAAEVLAKVYGGDQADFRAVSPRTLATQNAAAITAGSLVRVVIGDKDETFENNRLFHEHLASLKIPHTWTVLPGVAHDPMGVLRGMGDDNWAFYRAAFGSRAATPGGSPATPAGTVAPSPATPATPATPKTPTTPAPSTPPIGPPPPREARDPGIGHQVADIRGLPFETLLTQFDANKDGKIERKEVPESLHLQFDHLDRSKDGVLTRDDFGR